MNCYFCILHPTWWIYVCLMVVGCAPGKETPNDHPTDDQVNSTAVRDKNAGVAVGEKSANIEAKKSQSRSDHRVIIKWDESVSRTLFGFSAQEKVIGQSLNKIVSSEVVGRNDGELCSACHNQEAPIGGYGVDSAKNTAVKNLLPWDKVGIKRKSTWAGPNGWAMRFINNPTKPEALKKVMQAWVDGGYQ